MLVAVVFGDQLKDDVPTNGPGEMEAHVSGGAFAAPLYYVDVHVYSS